MGCGTGAQIVTDKAPGAGAPYSQAVSSGNMLFVSGQTGKVPGAGLAEGGLEAQVKMTCTPLLKTDQITPATLYETIYRQG